MLGILQSGICPWLGSSRVQASFGQSRPQNEGSHLFDSMICDAHAPGCLADERNKRPSSLTECSTD